MLDAPKVVWRGIGEARGVVKHAYQTAATVAGYVITIDPTTRRLTLAGAVVDMNPFLLTQTPLVFVTPTKAGARRWPIVSLTVTDARLVAHVLEKE